jgi:hypothetical protein
VTYSKKAVSLAIMNALGQCFSILGSHVYPSNGGPAFSRTERTDLNCESTEAPYYHVGFGLSCAFAYLNVLLAIFLMFVYNRENQKRDRLYGKPPPGVVDTREDADKAKDFRYML